MTDHRLWLERHIIVACVPVDVCCVTERRLWLERHLKVSFELMLVTLCD